MARWTDLGCLGLLISERASIKAVSRSGTSAMWRSMIAPASGLPKLSQLAGTAFQMCLIHISSQCTVGITKSANNTTNMECSTKNQWYHMMSASVSQECAVQNVR